MSGKEETKVKRTLDITTSMDLQVPRTRLRKKPTKDPDYDYTDILSSDGRPMSSDYDEREDRILKRTGKFNRKQKNRVLLRARNSHRTALNPPPHLTYGEAFREIIHQSHMLKQMGEAKSRPLVKGEVLKVDSPTNHLKTQIKGGVIQGIMIDLLHVDKPEAALKSITIPRKALPDGMIFVICKNELVGDVINHFEVQEFKYAENMVIVPIKKEFCFSKGVNSSSRKKTDINPNSNSIKVDKALLCTGFNEFCCSVSQTVVMMRRWGPSMKSTIVIQHQRTCDTCFYVHDGELSFPWRQLYTAVETLLPKASRGPKAQFMQLWGNEDSLKDGWVKVLMK